MKLLIICCLILTASCIIPSNSNAIQWRDDLNSALKEAENIEKPVMIDFYTDWCGWCKRLDEFVYSDKNVGNISGNFICVKINAEKNRSIATKYRITAYPTILFLNYKGAIDERVTGYLPAAEFAQKMSEILSKTLKPSGKLTAQPVAKRSKFWLGGVTLNSRGAKAIVNDLVVTKGDVVDGATVTDIGKKSVKLMFQGKEIVLSME